LRRCFQDAQIIEDNVPVPRPINLAPSDGFAASGVPERKCFQLHHRMPSNAAMLPLHRIIRPIQGFIRTVPVLLSGWDILEKLSAKSCSTELQLTAAVSIFCIVFARNLLAYKTYQYDNGSLQSYTCHWQCKWHHRFVYS
jgi:hypothetical protein